MSKRPLHNCKAVIDAAAKALLPQIIEWVGDEPHDPDAMLDDLSKALYADDGYLIARDLERKGWNPDEELVAILIEAFIHKSDAHEAMVKEWVHANSVKLELAVDVEVDCPQGRGTIMDLRPDMAQYIVAPHDPKFAEGGGWVVNAEDCKVVVEEQTA